MTAGKLASVRPGATTNTTLYQCPIDRATSAIVDVVNAAGTAGTYRLAVRDYNQIATLNGSSYDFRKGNVVSDYKIQIEPAITDSEFNPGETLSSADGKVSCKYQDIFKPTERIDIPVKVQSVGNLAIDTGTYAGGDGAFDLEDTLTGATTGLQATFYGSEQDAVVVNLPAVATGDTSVIVNTVGTIAVNDLIAFNAEVAEITAIATNTLTITRAQLGTTAVAADPGTSFTALSPDAVTTTINEGATFAAGDDTLTVTDSTGFLVSDVIRIGNEFLTITGLAGNDLTVARGNYGTTDAAHVDGSTVTRMEQVANGFINVFADGETIGNGVVTVSVGTIASYSQMNHFIYERSAIGADPGYTLPGTFVGNLDRVYRFIQEDASNAGHPLKFSTTPDGVHATPTPGTEYTTGVTIAGTPGSVGAYTEINLSYDNVAALDPNFLYIYCENHSGMGVTFEVLLTPFYNEIYVYDVVGEFTLTEGIADATNAYTVNGITPGPYGYILEDRSGSTVKVAAGTGSIAINDQVQTTITGAADSNDITVGSNTGLVVGMHVSGTGIDYDARITEINGTTITLSQPNSGAVSGNGDFNWQFQDSPTEAAAERSIATVLTNADIADADYIAYDAAIAANTTTRVSSTVVGPGQSVMGYSSSGSINFVLNGFEDSTADFTPVLYVRERSA
ncbi:hypothetical protein [Synechococcus phage S-H38]|uniref:Tail fiber protein n=1 Tax=Synechococcus phage S-H38 TaxID=2783673 RepID=A0A873WA03_9CAUD|nr:hypothetical protein PQC14_gp151 [Synechococcus phage S-H38]QPB07910.1 hypothetical protein [Synechococcus phage S-H38]